MRPRFFSLTLNSIAFTKPFLGFAGRLAMEPAKPRAGFIGLRLFPMLGKIIRVVEDDNFTTYLIWLKELNICARTYSGKGYRNYNNWRDLKIGDFIDGLEWKDDKRKLLDADSLIHLEH